MILLVGPLAQPQLHAALGLETGQPGQSALRGRLTGGAGAGIGAEPWPDLSLDPQAPAMQGWLVEPSPALARYAEIMGLEVIALGEERFLGARLTEDAGKGEIWSPEDWPADYAADLARWLLSLPEAQEALSLRKRLPRIADWVAAQRRAAREPSAADPGPDYPDRLKIIDRAEPYAHFFSVETLRLQHRLFAGGWSEELDRAVFVSGDATVVLPWDPVRDRVLLIDQFRPGPAVRGDRAPWLYETIAGRLDGDESPETAARREAQEEAGVTLKALIPGPHHYSSPGASAEMLYLFIGIADLPDGIEGIGGLEGEGEDIRSHLVSRAELGRMLREGQIRNGPLLVLALWLEAEAERLKQEFTPV